MGTDDLRLRRQMMGPHSRPKFKKGRFPMIDDRPNDSPEKTQAMVSNSTECSVNYQQPRDGTFFTFVHLDTARQLSV